MRDAAVRVGMVMGVALCLSAGLAPGCGNGGDQTAEQKLCQRTCAKLAGCGVATLSSCASDCAKMPAYVACLDASGGSCNDIALCTFEQACGGVKPSGDGTCSTAATCASSCEASGIDCKCSCAAAMDAGKALNLLIRSSCAEVKCQGACGVEALSSSSCEGCYQQQCASANTQCLER
jgi:hypothetical protein